MDRFGNSYVLGSHSFLPQYLCVGIWRTGGIDYDNPSWWIFIYLRLGLASNSSIPHFKEQKIKPTIHEIMNKAIIVLLWIASVIADLLAGFGTSR